MTFSANVCTKAGDGERNREKRKEKREKGKGKREEGRGKNGEGLISGGGCNGL